MVVSLYHGIQPHKALHKGYPESVLNACFVTIVLANQVSKYKKLSLTISGSLLMVMYVGVIVLMDIARVLAAFDMWPVCRIYLPSQHSFFFLQVLCVCKKDSKFVCNNEDL